jgi:hypothetical protein
MIRPNKACAAQLAFYIAGAPPETITRVLQDATASLYSFLREEHRLDHEQAVASVTEFMDELVERVGAECDAHSRDVH